MTATPLQPTDPCQEVDPSPAGSATHADDATARERWLESEPGASLAAIAPLRKAAIVLVSLEQSLASQLLAQLDRSSVEAVTWEIARLERIDPAEQAAVLDEFLGLGLRRLCFVFEDLLRMQRSTTSAGPITTRTPPPGRWPSPAQRRRCEPRCWVPWTQLRGAALRGSSRASARSGSPTPKRPRPRSPSGSAASTTRVRSVCPNPADAKRSWSDGISRPEQPLASGRATNDEQDGGDDREPVDVRARGLVVLASWFAAMAISLHLERTNGRSKLSRWVPERFSSSRPPAPISTRASRQGRPQGPARFACRRGIARTVALLRPA